MKKLKRRLWALCLAVMIIITGMPMNVLATEQEKQYPYTVFAGKDVSFSGNVLNANGSIRANRAIMYQCMNGIVNGTSSSAVATYGTNSHVTARKELTGQEAEPMIYIGSKLMEAYFTKESRVETLSRIESNMNLNSHIFSMTNASVNGNINMNQAAMGAVDNIEIGTAKIGHNYNVNANQAVLYSVKGDIVIDATNFNFSGLIYAPNGNVEIISRGNLGIQGVIIAQNVNLQGCNINLQSDATFATFVAEAMQDENEEPSETPSEEPSEDKSEDISEMPSEEPSEDESEDISEMPSEEPSENGSEDISETPSEESSEDESEEPSETPEEEIDYTDTDGDGLIDVIELEIGTNIEMTDTDEDGLSDFDEIYLTVTNPLKKDTDDDGVIDSQEDMDEDGLSAHEEIEAGTLPSYADTDCDGLLDGEEGKYSTNPLKPDTDDDGLADGDEIGIGLDPCNPTTFGVPDAEYVLLQKIDATSDILSSVNVEENAYSVSVEAKVSGNLSANLTVDETDYAAVIANDCMVGMPIELAYDDKCQVEAVTLSFDIKDAYTDNELNYFSDENDPSMYSPELVGIKRLQVFKYFEDSNMLLPIETFHDTEANIVKTVVDEFGVYCLMDIEKWILSLAEQGDEFQIQPAVMSLDAGAVDDYNEWKPEETACGSVESLEGQADYIEDELIEAEEMPELNSEPLESADEIEEEADAKEASEDVVVESINEDATVLRSPVMRANTEDNTPIDIVFILQTSGNDENAYNCEVQNIIDVSEKLFSLYSNARIGIITFGIDEAGILGGDTAYWYKSAEELASSLYEIKYSQTYEYCNRGLAFDILVKQITFRSSAAKYVYFMQNGYSNVFGNYFSQLDACAKMNIIYSEVLSPNIEYESQIYKERVEAAIAKTQGIMIRSGSTSGEEIWNHICKYVPEEMVEFKAITAVGWETIILEAPLDSNNGVDTDGDTLLDWYEVDVDNELLVWNADGSVELPTIHECMMSDKPVYVERGLERILGAEGIPSDAAGEMVAQMIYTYRIMPINSDPTCEDSDEDGYVDVIDINPLKENYIPTRFREYIKAGYIEYTDLRYSQNNFTICLKSLGEIMDAMGITAQGYDEEKNGISGNRYFFSDWYLYGIKCEQGGEMYSIIKMRTCENYVQDKIGVSVPFCEFDLDMLDNNYDYVQLGMELESITEEGISTVEENRIQSYFSGSLNPNNYFIADVYLELIVKQDVMNDNSSFSLPSTMHERVKELLNNNDDIYDSELNCINVSDINNLTLEERQCLLASRAGTISYNAFAAEIVAHAQVAIATEEVMNSDVDLPGGIEDNDIVQDIEMTLSDFVSSIYESARKADLGVAEGLGSNKEKVAELFFAYEGSPYVILQEVFWGEF